MVATATTIRDYEAILARMSLTLADKDPLEVTVDDLRDVIDLWADREARTRAKVTSVVRAFWAWAEEQDQVPFSPATKLRRPRAPRKTAPLLPQSADARLLNAATTARDRVGLLLLLDLGIRRSELTGIRPNDIDLGRRQITVFGKGQKSRVIHFADAWCWRSRHTSWRLSASGADTRAGRLHPLPREADGRRAAPSGVPEAPDERTDGASLVVPPRPSCGLVGAGMTSGLNMHRARHTFAMDLRRIADLGAASQALGHSDLSTTASIYGHYDLSDLERAMEALARSRREDEEPTD